MIGLIGTFITAYFGFRANIVPTEISISATKTAEAAIVKPITVTPDNTLTATQTSVAMQTQVVFPTTTILRVNQLSSNCYDRIFPTTVDPALYPNEAIEEYNIAKTNGSFLDWTYDRKADNDYFEGYGPAYLITFELTNIATEGHEQVIITNPINATISHQEISPKVNSVLNGCGGGGSFREFSPIDLNNDSSKSMAASQSIEFDYLTLQPSESEVLSIPLYCKDVGIYTLNFSFSYSYLGESNKIEYIDKISVACPEASSLWMLYEDEIILYANYGFKDDRYIRQP